MPQAFASRVRRWATLMALAAAFMVVEQPRSLGADAPVKKVLSKRRGRLPAYYAAVVTDEQREKIYQIQEEYRPKIAALNAQLKALKKEQDDKITALLTATQKKQIAEAAAEAKKEPAKAPASSPPTAPKSSK
jgi:hypothetical protein